MRVYLLVLLVAAGVTYLLGGLCRRLAFRFNAVANVRARDVHTKPVPYFGGIAMLVGMGAAFLVGSQLPWLNQFDQVWYYVRGVALGGAVICVVGVIDDLFELNALAKTAGQMLAAGIAVITGVKILWIPFPGMIVPLDQGFQIVVTMILIFISVNAINLIDGLDGLAAGIVAIGAAAFFTYAFLLAYLEGLIRATTSSLVSVVTIGICLGFLPYNVHKAKMFMGDSGSMLLGFLMAASVISLTGQIDPSRLGTPGASVLAAYLPLVLPLGVMALPLLDMAMAYVRRSVHGQKWWKPDKQHLHHRMLRLGHGHLQAVFLLWLWAALVAFGVVLIGLLPGPATIGGVAAGVVVASILTWGRWPGKPRKKAA